jgi:hypothetical protein
VCWFIFSPMYIMITVYHNFFDLVTLTSFVNTVDSSYTWFHYLQFYFSVTKSINIRSMASIQAAVQTHWAVLGVSLTYLTISMWGTTYILTKFHESIS